MSETTTLPHISAAESSVMALREAAIGGKRDKSAFVPIVMKKEHPPRGEKIHLLGTAGPLGLVLNAVKRPDGAWAVTAAFAPDALLRFCDAMLRKLRTPSGNGPVG